MGGGIIALEGEDNFVLKEIMNTVIRLLCYFPTRLRFCLYRKSKTARTHHRNCEVNAAHLKLQAVFEIGDDVQHETGKLDIICPTFTEVSSRHIVTDLSFFSFPCPLQLTTVPVLKLIKKDKTAHR